MKLWKSVVKKRDVAMFKIGDLLRLKSHLKDPTPLQVLLQVIERENLSP